jgi:hypothetical protein
VPDRPDTRRHGTETAVLEVAEQLSQPTRLSDGVRIKKRDEGTREEGAGGVSGRGRSAWVGPAHEHGAGCGRDGLQAGGAVIGRSVVDYDDGSGELRPQLLEQAGDGAIVVPHGHDDGDLVDSGAPGGRQRMQQAAGGEARREGGRSRSLRARAGGLAAGEIGPAEIVEDGGARRAQPQQTERFASEQHPAPGPELADTSVERVPPWRRAGDVSRRRGRPARSCRHACPRSPG